MAIATVQTSTWTGKACSKNRWLKARAYYDKVTRKPKAMMYSSAEYKQFLEALAIQFRVDLEPIKGKFDIALKMRVHHMTDDHNFLFAVFDALESSGIIENDRHAELKIIYPPERHGNGEDDIIQVWIREAQSVNDPSGAPYKEVLW